MSSSRIKYLGAGSAILGGVIWLLLWIHFSLTHGFTYNMKGLLFGLTWIDSDKLAVIPMLLFMLGLVSLRAWQRESTSRLGTAGYIIALVCSPLVIIGQAKSHGQVCNVFEARRADCRGCRWQKQCCGENGGPRRVSRVVESPAMKQYLKRMKQTEIKTLYKKRSEIAEFPHLWAKGVKKWRRFSVRGAVKAGMEAFWVALAYNVTQWMRIGAERLASA